MGRFINYAHRGASGYCPENTMAAFEEAIALGATGIETDVQMTKDHRLVLIHDESLFRTTGKQRMVKELTFAELKKLDAGRWFHRKFRGETVPALEDLLDFVRQKDIMLNVELKNGLIFYPNIEERLIGLIRRYGLSERVVISSFNHYSVARVKQLAPEMKTAILYASGLFKPWTYARRIGAKALHAHHSTVTPNLVDEARQNDVIYTPYTVNQPYEMERLLQAGVEGIITNYPDRLDALLAKAVV